MNNDADVYRALIAAAEGGTSAALATVVRVRGSVPRDVGSKMLIQQSGLVGTIGGGCGEGDVIAAAQEVMQTGVARLLRVELTDALDTWSPAMCGGVMEIFIEPVPPAQPAQ